MKAERRKKGHNPVELNRSLTGAVEKLPALNREKGYAGDNPGQGEGQTAAA
jgi:hypothetical protein